MREIAAYSPTACVIDPTATYDEWANELAYTALTARGANFWLGDALVYGEAQWGEEKMVAAMEPDVALALGEGSIRSCQWVSRAIPPDHRRAELTWSHHRAVAAYTLPEIDQWLEAAVFSGWTCLELREQVRQAREAGMEPASRESDDYGGLGDPYDHPRFGEAARLRFGMTLGPEVESFVRSWIERHARALTRDIEW